MLGYGSIAVPAHGCVLQVLLVKTQRSWEHQAEQLMVFIFPVSPTVTVRCWKYRAHLSS